MMSALYAENGSVWIRMYEFNGQTASAWSNRDLCEANLLGEKTGLEQHRRVELGAHKIRTFSIEPVEPVEP